MPTRSIRPAFARVSGEFCGCAWATRSFLSRICGIERNLGAAPNFRGSLSGFRMKRMEAQRKWHHTRSFAPSAVVKRTMKVINLRVHGRPRHSCSARVRDPATREQFLKNVTHRITWMPRLCTPTKDVASCDKPRKAARQAHVSGDVRMGKPHGSYIP